MGKGMPSANLLWCTLPCHRCIRCLIAVLEHGFGEANSSKAHRDHCGSASAKCSHGRGQLRTPHSSLNWRPQQSLSLQMRIWWQSSAGAVWIQGDAGKSVNAERNNAKRKPTRGQRQNANLSQSATMLRTNMPSRRHMHRPNGTRLRKHKDNHHILPLSQRGFSNAS